MKFIFHVCANEWWLFELADANIWGKLSSLAKIFSREFAKREFDKYFISYHWFTVESIDLLQSGEFFRPDETQYFALCFYKLQWTPQYLTPFRSTILNEFLLLSASFINNKYQANLKTWAIDVNEIHAYFIA